MLYNDAHNILHNDLILISHTQCPLHTTGAAGGRQCSGGLLSHSAGPGCPGPAGGLGHASGQERPQGQGVQVEERHPAAQLLAVECSRKEKERSGTQSPHPNQNQNQNQNRKTPILTLNMQLLLTEDTTLSSHLFMPVQGGGVDVQEVTVCLSPYRSDACCSCRQGLAHFSIELSACNIVGIIVNSRNINFTIERDHRVSQSIAQYNIA